MGHRDNGPMPGTRHQAIMKTFGKRLKTAREKAGFASAQQFAHILGIEPATYRKYERGAAEPNFETLTRLCEHLNVTPDYLLPLAAKAGTSRGEKA
jgi:transcriptional regulator with XRE-family HTH domain